MLGGRRKARGNLGIVGVGGLQELDLGAEHPVEKEVALRHRPGCTPEQEDAPQAEMCSSGGRCLAEIGLCSRGGDQGVCAGRKRVCDDRFKLARLVASHRESGKVLALHDQGSRPDGLGESIRRHQRVGFRMSGTLGRSGSV